MEKNLARILPCLLTNQHHHRITLQAFACEHIQHILTSLLTNASCLLQTRQPSSITLVEQNHWFFFASRKCVNLHLAYARRIEPRFMDVRAVIDRRGDVCHVCVPCETHDEHVTCLLGAHTLIRRCKINF
jgi:hypothetical protein